MTVQQLYKIPKNNPNVFWFQKPKTQTKLSLNQTKKKNRKSTDMEWTNHVNIKKTWWVWGQKEIDELVGSQ
jgi:hypothetical protein